MAKKFNQLAADLRKMAAQMKRFSKNEALTIIGVEAVKATRRNFQVQGMIRNGNVDKWKPKQYNPKGKRTLHQSGNLKAAVRYWKTGDRVEIGVDGSKIPYAKLHQQGGMVTVPITPRMRKFFWAKHFETGDDKYKAMALTKQTTLTIDMPQRKYLELTPDIIKAITRRIDLRLDKMKP